MDLRFHHLESLHWLWLVLAAGAFMVLGWALRRRDLGRFADPALLGRLLAGVIPGRRVGRAALRLAALLLLTGALLDPRWGIVYQQVEQRGVDIVVVLDVSRSMLAEDAKPNRLERARQYIGDLVEALGGDRVGLVAFAGVPELKCPLTVDYGAFRLALADATPKSAPRGGSLLGDALRLAAQAFPDQVPDHKAIVVFTDGEDQGSEAVEAAKRLREELSVPVYTVGIGDSGEGARIPVESPAGKQYLTWQGQEVWSKMNPELLRQVALESGGAFIPVGTGTVDMGRLYAERIEPIAGQQLDPVTLKRREPRYQWLAGLALVLLLAETLVGARARKRRSDGATERRREGSALSFAVVLLAATAAIGAGSDPAVLKEAGRALAEKRYDEALSLYEQARQLDPQAAEIPYNMGVAAYRKGDLDRAGQLFDQARMLASDPALRARAAYNLGTTAYHKSIEQPQGDAQAQGQAPAQMQQAGDELKEAIDRFRESLDADPADMDARVNGELAWRWLEQLKQMQQQQQNQQQQQQQDQQQQEDQQQQQQQDQQQQDQQQNQQQQEQQQQQQQQGGEEGQQNPQQEEQQQEQQAQAQEGQDQQDQQQQATPKESAEDRPMSRQEAERLLQGVRDRQRQRQEEMARQRNARKPLVDKDW